MKSIYKLITLSVFSSLSMSFAFGQNAINISKEGNVGIGVDNANNLLDIKGNANRTGNHPANLLLYVTPNQASGTKLAEFRTADASQGIGLGYNSIYAAGNNGNQDLMMAAKGDQGSLLFQTRGTDRLKIDGSGNVDIGNTSNPIYNKLQLGGNLHMNGNAIYFREGVTDKAQMIKWQGVVKNGVLENDRLGIGGWDGVILGITSVDGAKAGSITPILLANHNKRVGINTMNPNAFLDIGNTLDNGAYGAIFGRLNTGNDKGNGTFLGVKGYNGGLNQKSFALEYNDAGETTSSINFYKGASAGWSYITFGITGNYEAVRINEFGYVGIGTTIARFPLEVYASQTQSPCANCAAKTISIFAEKAIATMSEFVTYSDARIKKDLKHSNSADDLDILNRIEVTDYKYIDSSAYSHRQRKGVIAQQIEQIIPEAILKTEEFIPATLSKPVKTLRNEQVVSFVMNAPHHFVNGDIIKLFVNRVMEQKAVTVLSKNSFSIAATAADYSDVFIYGKRVEDFRTVDYDLLFTLNISATQQLSKEIKELKAENAAMKNAYGDLSEKINKLEAKLSNTNVGTSGILTATK